jgi:hypothetical protein
MKVPLQTETGTVADLTDRFFAFVRERHGIYKHRSAQDLPASVNSQLMRHGHG